MSAKTHAGSSRRKIRQAVCETLENRLFLAAQISVTTTAHVGNVVAFNAVAPGYTPAGPSSVETATLTNTGSSPLTFGSGAFTILNKAGSNNAADFTITNTGSLPSSLAPGASAVVDLQYSASALYLQQAVLQITSNDPVTPVLNVDLNGIGTPGQFGTNEPSLVQVLRAHDIPTIVGAGPNDVNINTQKYPITPDPSSQEVPMQRLVAANSALPVTIMPIASFSAATQPVSQIGYYTPGNPNATTELFYINKAGAQIVDPIARGATSFDPGSRPFGLYGEFVGTTTSNGSLDFHYSEDALNILDLAHARKIRFFPLKNANGSVVPNSFVFAVEDYNDPTAYNSFINFVGIVSNVRAAPNATQGSTPANPTANNPPVMGVQPNQNVPGSNNLVFNVVKIPNSIVADIVHTTDTVTIHNTGDQPLVINSLTLANTTSGSTAPASSLWQLVNPPAPGTSIAGGASLVVTLKFVATSNPPHSTNQINNTTTTNGVSPIAAGAVWDGTLTITSNDSINPTRVTNLTGFWQYQSEHENEPGLSTIDNLMFGYSVSDAGSAASQYTEYPNNGLTTVLYGAEVDPQTNQGLFVAAQANLPVQLTDVACWIAEYRTVNATVGATTYSIASATESGTTVTITTAGSAGFKTGDQVTITGVTDSGYDGTFTITSTPTPKTFTYTAASSGLANFNAIPNTPQIGWYAAGTSSSTHFLYKQQPNNAQSVFPLLSPDSYSTVKTSFIPSGAFGINFDGEKSQDALNTVAINTYMRSGHSVRVFPAITASGNVIPNTWILAFKYLSGPFENFDYNDFVCILSNATFEGMPGTPSDLQASGGASGVNLQWAPAYAAAGYNVYASVNGGTLNKLNSSPIMTPSFTDSTASGGAMVKYQVTAVNSGGIESIPADASITPAANSGPASPSIQQADGSSGTQVVLTWTASAGATSYNVQREDPGQSTFHSVASGLTTTTFMDTNVIVGSTYQYEVQAVGTSGSSAFSAAASATVAHMSAPPVPVIQSADGSSGTQVVVSWTASTGATSYNVQREDPGQSTFHSVASGLTTTFTDTNVTAGSTYQYEVQAVGTSGSSTFSAPASATVTTPASAPPATTIQSADGSSGTQVVVTWSASSGATSYTVERQDPGTSTYQVVSPDGGVAATSFTDATVAPGVTYNYEVIAVNSVGPSPSSTPFSVTVAIPVVAPSAPTNVQATLSTDSVAITWDASAGAATYDLQREGSGDTTFSDVATGVTSTAYTDINVQAGQTYQYQVLAVGAGGTSAPSSPPVSAMIPGGATLDITIGKGASAFVSYVTAAGTTVTVRLGGAGVATVHFTADSISQAASGKGMVVTGQNVSIANISTTGTTAASALSIMTKGGNKTVGIGGISASASLGSINAQTATLTGALSVTGTVKRIVLGAATAASINLTGALGAFQAKGDATGLTLTCGGAIGRIVARSWTSNHAITAPSVGSINIRGDAELNITSGAVRILHVGAALHDSTIILTAGGTLDLASLSAGAIDNTGIGAAGNLGSISAVMLLNTQIYAGNGAQLLGVFPPASGGFPAPASIANVTLRKTAGVVNDTNSSIAASTLKHLALGTVRLNNSGAPFGVEANVIDSLSFAGFSGAKRATLTRLTSVAVVAADLANKGINTEDFKIDIV